MVFINFIISLFFSGEKKDILKVAIKYFIYILILMFLVGSYFYISNLKNKVNLLNADLISKNQTIELRETKIVEMQNELNNRLKSKEVDNKIIINKIKKEKEVKEITDNSIQEINNEIKEIQNNRTLDNEVKKDKIDDLVIEKIYGAYCRSVGLEINECIE